ncbi:MAG: HAD-IIA family hydrolase [Sneathiellales bacterium]|nr:HAD-IIA family hydrolase [Sneathiellales bacterium]
MRQTINTEWVFNRYQQVRNRLPSSTFPKATQIVPDLGSLIDQFDVFVFDSFGVLNVGSSPIPGAVDRIRQLRARNKHVYILTNAASIPLDRLEEKYDRLGFDFKLPEIISSREVLIKALENFDPEMNWAVISEKDFNVQDLPVKTHQYTGAKSQPCDGYIFLSSAGWSEQHQSILQSHLEKSGKPLLIANPDLAAPREDAITFEPGVYAHDLADQLKLSPLFFGKPYGNAFDLLKERLITPVATDRMLMIGDTLHTDILGGKAAGLQTALVTAHGVLRDLDPADCISSSGIVPDFQMPSI